MRRVIFCAVQLMNRAASIAKMTSRAIFNPRVMIHSPIPPRQKSCQRCVIENARYVVLFVIFPIAPTDARLQEAVDVSVEYRGRIADLVVVPQILDHLVRVQHVGAHLIAPRTAAVTLPPTRTSASSS